MTRPSRPLGQRLESLDAHRGLIMVTLAFGGFGLAAKPWTAHTLKIRFGPGVFEMFGSAWEPTVRAAPVGLCFWLVCYWVYRRKIFLRL